MNDESLPFGTDSSRSALDEAEEKTSVIGRTGRERSPKTKAQSSSVSDTDQLFKPQHHVGALELGHFDVLETIGRGGFGVVVKAFDQKLQRIVAIKMMSAEMAATSPARKRFVREARAGAAVRHDNVVRIYAVEEQPIPHLVMEYVPGESLQSYLDRTGPTDVREVLRIGAQIARGLAAAHATGLVHRDIKPANVLLEEGEYPRVKLTDFGLARAADDASLSQSGMVVGTPLYMAPEQARGESFDHRADLYSLGSVLYVMVSGRPPFRAPNSLAVMRRVAEETPRPIREIIPETPQWLCDLIGKLHGRKPEDRFASAAEVAGVLETCLAELQQGGIVKPPVLPARTPSRWKRWRTGVAIGLLTLAAIATGFAAFWPSAPSRNSETAAPTPPPVPSPNPEPVAKSPARSGADFTSLINMEFVRVPHGKSILLGENGVPGTRKIDITYDFYIGKYEVTREEWEKVMGPGTARSLYSRTGALKATVSNVPNDELKRFPVDGVSWNECQEFVRRLNEREKEGAWVYRLPLSTEWEYACRNGPGQSDDDLRCDFYAGEPSTTLAADQANFAATGLNRPCSVGSFPPNRLGIHDLHGNVFELLDDMAGDNKDSRLLAGGFWVDKAPEARAAMRSYTRPEIRLRGSGLRLVRVPIAQASTPRMQFEMVAAELNRLNPAFKGRILPELVDDRIVELHVTDSDPIVDISPLSHLHDLRVLTLEGGQFTDLSPLSRLPLRRFETLNFTVSDLGPLKGVPLEHLSVWGFQGTDLSPLEGMNLRWLNCGGGHKAINLAPLKGMPLRYLCVNLTEVDDLTPLAGLPLEELLIDHTQVKSLSALKGRKLQVLSMRGLHPKDLTVIRDMPLRNLKGEFRRDRDTELLRSLKSLAEINEKPVEEFWKAFEKK